MTLTLNLPEALAARLASTLPEEERDRFALAAIEDALSARQMEAEARLEMELLADFDAERDAAEYRAAIDEGLNDVETNHELVSFDEVQRRWEADKATNRA